jgi:hypothetical protein
MKVYRDCDVDNFEFWILALDESKWSAPHPVALALIPIWYEAVCRYAGSMETQSYVF